MEKIIDSIINSLKDSTKTSWDTGDLTKWADYANKMRTSIKNAVSVLESLDFNESSNSKLSKQIAELIKTNKELTDEIKKANITFPPYVDPDNYDLNKK